MPKKTPTPRTLGGPSRIRPTRAPRSARGISIDGPKPTTRKKTAK